MTTTREATWSRVGHDIGAAKSINEALTMSNLDYNVRKEPVYTLNPNNITTYHSYEAIPGRFVTKTDDHIFGIVGNDYTICQNKEAFDFINYIEEDISFVKAGMTKGGLVYIIAKMPDTHVLGDGMTPYVIFQNGFNGYTPVKAAIYPLRIECQNQFNLAFRNAENSLKIGHFSNMESKMADARGVLKIAASYMKRFEDEAMDLATTHIEGLEEKIVSTFYVLPEEASERVVNRIEEKRSELLSLYKNVGDNQNFRGTAWGLVNAFADQFTHQAPGRKSEGWEETRFITATFNAQPMQRLVDVIREVAA